MSSFDKKLPNDLPRIWEVSEQENTPTGPIEDVKEEIKALVNKATKLQNEENYFDGNNWLQY